MIIPPGNVSHQLMWPFLQPLNLVIYLQFQSPVSIHIWYICVHACTFFLKKEDIYQFYLYLIRTRTIQFCKHLVEIFLPLTYVDRMTIVKLCSISEPKMCYFLGIPTHMINTFANFVAPSLQLTPKYKSAYSFITHGPHSFEKTSYILKEKSPFYSPH